MEMVALYDFTPSKSEELRFAQGDTLKIWNVDDPDWLYGELNGQVGLIPENYVAYTLPLWYIPVTKADAVGLLNTKRGNSFLHPEGAFLVRPSEANRNELSISVRIRDVQHFKILKSDTPDQYFLWRSGPSFPSITQLVAYYRTTSISNKDKAVLRDLNLSRVIASYDFDGRTREELTIKRNEIITVLDRTDPDWCSGQLERDHKTYRGIFPSTYVTDY